ncbi:MAG: radical SAM protein [Proteobacteria bacterium]|nr:radical SAM protein [Pseudomonadota bacterium]MBU1388096.1 radical SAM protein [Pseudomonadota bacterium]MBU1542160.1 radical SAM protein [Pseudomonadota bacterium]MBU2481684.1 radical SAM protein [Pseudomonadota bacterium]
MKNSILTAVVAAENGEIFELEGYGAVGLSGNTRFILNKKETVPMPHGSELMLLPNRKPIVYNLSEGTFETLEFNPFALQEKIFPVAVFNSPGYVNRHFCAYDTGGITDMLPLFSYGAVGFGTDDFRSAALLVDSEPRQDLRQMPRKGIVKGVKKMQEKYPENRLIRHLETCALQYGCPAGKNFFLKRYEAPLPTSTVCNANCLGCISLQTENNLCACQERIKFTPSPQEIAQVSLEHILSVKNAVVSFGQGCEGEPLTAVKSIEPAIRLIREKTQQGTINLNTNASLPEHVDALCRAGLDAMRVSMNSIREKHYTAYFRPRSYQFSDVLKSIDIAKKHEKFVAINYLNCPGFSDSEKEFSVLKQFIATHRIDMIQWRNLNFDPRAYYHFMHQTEDSGPALGMANIIKELSAVFPDLIHGYFNPPVNQLD